MGSVEPSKLFTLPVHGSGLDCRTGKVNNFEGSTDGIWNKVSAHTSWIMTKIKQAKTLESEGSSLQPRPEIHVDPETAFVPQWSLIRSAEERAGAAAARDYDVTYLQQGNLLDSAWTNPEEEQTHPVAYGHQYLF